MKNFFLLLFIVHSMLLGASSLSLEDKQRFLKELESSSKTIQTSNNYTLTKGWNTLRSPKSGVDVPQTFDTSAIKLVVTYDKKSGLWAIFTPDYKEEDKILFLKYLEPNRLFFVFANKNTTIDIKSIDISSSCSALMQDSSYEFMSNSVFDNKKTFNKERTLSIKTRYFTHHEKGIYNETRVMLIYPKIKAKGEAVYKYGPASPKVALTFSKEYEGKEFYIYNYKEQKCYQGYFPSIKIPPFPRLKEI